MNQYDVIYLNIQHFLTSPENYEKLGEDIEKKVLAELKAVYSQYLKGIENDLPTALAMIFHGEIRRNKGFVFIIDEWDCIFREAKGNEKAQKIYLDFLKRPLKDREYVKLAYMTGILPIKKYGTHSALNIFYEFSMTDPKKLAEYVGFTEGETKELCRRYGMDFEEAQRWYDGYCFERERHIYNPKSVVDAMLEEKFKNYWIGTETYEALKIYIDMNLDGLKDDVLTLLVHLGYLAFDSETEEVYIPNEEIKEEFIRATIIRIKRSMSVQ